MTETVAFGILIVSLVAAPLVARAVARRGGAVSWAAIASGFAGTGAYIFVNLCSPRVGWAFAENDMAILFPACGGVPILGGLGALFHRAKPGDLRALRVFLVALFCYFAWQATFLVGDPGAALGIDSGLRGPVRQTTSWSCAPASAATLLGTLGISASEAEMARLMRTRPTFGTETLLAEHGLSRKLAGTRWRTDLRPIDYDGLVAAGAPGLASVRLGFMLEHMVGLARATAETIEITDPATGTRRSETRAQFEAEWTGQAILVLPRGE